MIFNEPAALTPPTSLTSDSTTPCNSTSHTHNRNECNRIPPFRWAHISPNDLLVTQGIEPNPGPTHIVSHNVRGSLGQHLHSTLATDAIAIAVQEADTPEANVEYIKAEAATYGYAVAWGG